MNADIIGLRARCENRRKLGIFDAESDGDGEELATLTVPLLMLERVLASAPAPASGGVDAVRLEIERILAEDMRTGTSRIVQQLVELFERSASLSPAAMPVSEAWGEAAARSWRRTKFEFIGAMRQALINSGLTREQVIIADNAISEAFRRVREETRHDG